MMDLDDALKYAQNALERAFEDWLESERPSGDCESVHRQWDESFAHQELADELQPVLALTWEVRRLRDENERLRKDADRLEWLLSDFGKHCFSVDHAWDGESDLRPIIDVLRGTK